MIYMHYAAVQKKIHHSAKKRLKVIFGENFWDFANVVIMRLFLDSVFSG